MTSEIIFHDLTSQKWPYSWSPFTLRTTLCLNYLGLPYEHDEISYPDIAKTLSSLGVKPEPEDADKDIKYTLPAISVANETIMGSSAIAEKLASLKPEYEKKLFPQGQRSRDMLQKYEKEILAQVSKGMGGLPKHVVAFVPFFLDERGSEYFYATREPRLGKLETLRTEALEEEKEKGWKQLVKQAVMPMLEFYKEMNGDGKGIYAFGGDEPQYVDFCVVGFIQWWICARGEDDIMAALEEAGDGAGAMNYPSGNSKLKEDMKQYLDGAAVAHQEADQEILTIEEKTKFKQQQESQRQGEGA
ncbi:hypothetical protein KCV07_g8668, partial [Aureobasidium melanogenum]